MNLRLKRNLRRKLEIAEKEMVESAMLADLNQQPGLAQRINLLGLDLGDVLRENHPWWDEDKPGALIV